MFNFFKSKEIKKSPDLAEKIFEYRPYQPYINDCPDKDVREICKNCKNIQDTFNKVIEYCGPPNTPKARYIYALTYAWSRVEYNDLAIKYLELYLNDELYYPISDKTYHIFEMRRYLGQAYEKKRDLDSALKNYQICLQITNKYPAPYLDIANVYRKQNDLNKALEILKEATNSPFYINDFKVSIDNRIEEYTNKLKKGYKYKPRTK